MAIKAEEFEELRAWSACFIEHAPSFVSDLPPDAHPVAVFDALAAKSRGKARQGLEMMIADLVEASAGMHGDAADKLDVRFAEAGLPSLSAMRLRFQRKIRSVLKRGVIKNEVEYYALRNAIEGASGNAERERLSALLAAFEKHAAG